MNKLFSPLVFVAAFAALPLLAGEFPKGSPAFESSVAKVQAKAKKSGKPYILIFSADFCPPCVEMREKVYPSSEIAAFHDKFEWAYIDVGDESKAEEMLQEIAKYGISPLPHFKFFDKNGKPLGNEIGPANATGLAANLTRALDRVDKKEAPLPASFFPKGSPSVHLSLAEAQAAAKKSAKPVVMLFTGSWVPNSKDMKKKLFGDSDLAPLHDKFEWAYLDIFEEDNARAAFKYKVDSLPHVEIIDASGKSLGNQVGDASARDLAFVLKKTRPQGK